MLFACERLLPAVGGAELAALELLARLATRHHVRAMFLTGISAGQRGFAAPPPGVELLPVAGPPDAPAYWATQRRRRDVLGEAARAELEARPADLVLSQLRAAPGVIEAGHAIGAATVLIVPSYESLCKNAFDADSRCRPATGCRGCPLVEELDPAEGAEVIAAREAHERSRALADRLVANSRVVAEACEAWCGRRPEVFAPVAAAGPVLPAHPRGPVLLAASKWIKNKGLDLLVGLCAGLPERQLVVTEQGLPPGVRAELEALDQVRLVPSAPLRDLLRGAGILLMPAQWPEPFGRVAFEGLAAGVPTLASRVGGLPEFMPPDQLVDPPDSVRAWVDAVRRLADRRAWETARRDGIGAARDVAASAPLDRLAESVCQTARALEGVG